LWTSVNRAFPFVPFLTFWPREFDLFTFPVFILLLLGLLILLIRPDKNIGLWCFGFSLLFLLLQDLTRLQVWVYHLTWLLFLLFLKKDQQDLWPRLAMLALYFWSGFHKLNLYFLSDTFPWFLEKAGIFSFLGEYQILGLLVALFELGIAFGLYWPKTRKWAAIIAIAFHVVVLFLLGPFGHNWNEVVWPWNLAMMILLYCFFIQEEKSGSLNPFPAIRGYYFYLLPFVFLLILPGFNAFRLWDEQLSFKMYAGTNPEGIFYFDQRDQNCFSNAPIIHRSLSPAGHHTGRFILDDFAFQELKVPPYASERRLQQVGQYFCNCLTYPQHAGLEILWVHPWDKDREKLMDYSCLELLRENKKRR